MSAVTTRARRPEESGYLLITFVFSLKNQGLLLKKGLIPYAMLAFPASLDLTRFNEL